MSETPSTSETIAYQPISGWAIAGLGVSGLFTLMVVGSAIVGLFQGAPVFFPIWMLTLAGVGALLSYIGQRHIETSENTRTGLKLARLGLWLGIISGVSYLSYFYVTGLALEAQANSFLLDETDNDSGFFPRLRKGGTELNAAFLLTRPAQARSARPSDEKGMNEHYNTPTKEGPGDLTQFREGQIARIFFKELGTDTETKVEPGQFLEWTYAKRSYAVRRMYVVKTKELTAELHVTVQSSEGESEGQGRKWFVNMRETFMKADSLTLTPLGVGVKNLRDHARPWLTDWITSLNNGAGFSDFAAKDKTNWDLVPIQAPGIEPAKIREAVRRGFERTDKNRLQQYILLYREGRPELDVGKWESIKGRIRVYYSFHVTIQPDASTSAPLKIEATAALETREPVDPTRFIDRMPSPGWNLMELRISQVTLQGGRGP